MLVPELRTERLLLRPWRAGDIDDVLAYAVDEAWSHFLVAAVPYPYTRSDAEQFIALQLRRCADPADAQCCFAIEHEGRAVGGIDLRPEDDARAEVGYSIGTWLWGRGLITEALRAVVGFAFLERGCERLYAEVDTRNAGSLRVLEKCGFQREGVLRSHRILRHGERADMAVYGLLREEWTGDAS